MKFFTYITGVILLIPAIFAKLLDYSEKDWPATCKGNRNSPINFPADFTYNTSNYFELISTDYKIINGMKFDITDMKSYHIPNITADHGTLFVRKNGITYRYTLLDVHFHILSEHTMNGKASATELHMVHQKDLNYLAANNITDTAEDAVNKYLVVGTLFDADSDTDNADFAKFKIGSTESITDLDLKKFSRIDQPYYHYIGGLTTPNCDEIVNWVVNINPVKISASQNLAMKKWINGLYPNGNARVVQNLNNRVIYKIDKSPITPAKTSAGYIKGNMMMLISALIASFFL